MGEERVIQEVGAWDEVDIFAFRRRRARRVCDAGAFAACVFWREEDLGL